MKKTRIQPANVYQATTYAHGIRVQGGDIVFISGQVSKDVNNVVVGKGDIGQQAEQVFQNVKAVMESAGGTLQDIVKLTIFTTNLGFYRPGITSVRDKYFAENPPATTFVVVTSLSDPSLLLEVEAIGVVPSA